ncbi:SDR family oxidoreductase [Aliagarivorans taiwanensis]|uniref:SDR family oxidoreductase n=1 Tax=Aliagarivorans taiwanensis TaxID=561966 RepID=UPI0003F6ACE8|nr:SDR family oxidoreductase [Aliagarivorans taiwanensis]
MSINRISIVGLGWLGMPLASRLIELGYQVVGSKRAAAEVEQARSLGIDAYPLELAPHIIGDTPAELFNADLLIINIPPGRKQHSAECHQAQISALLDAAKQAGVAKVLFISSTSVYGPQQGIVTEQSPEQPDVGSGTTLLHIEQQLLPNGPWQASCLRFGGLVGGERKPGRFLSGKTLSGANSPVNLIHRDDCIGVISALIKRDIWGETFNVCADGHPSRQQFYTRAAECLALPPPQFNDQPGSNKWVDNALIKQTLDYQFVFPDPMQWLSATK